MKVLFLLMIQLLPSLVISKSRSYYKIADNIKHCGPTITSVPLRNSSFQCAMHCNQNWKCMGVRLTTTDCILQSDMLPEGDGTSQCFMEDCSSAPGFNYHWRLTEDTCKIANMLYVSWKFNLLKKIWPIGSCTIELALTAEVTTTITLLTSDIQTGQAIEIDGGSLTKHRQFIITWCSGEIVVTKGGLEFSRLTATVNVNQITHVGFGVVESSGNYALVQTNHLVDLWYPRGTRTGVLPIDPATGITAFNDGPTLVGNPQTLFDNNHNTFWNPQHQSSWSLTFDMEDVYTVTSIDLTSHGDVTHDVKDFKLELSNDSASWSPLTTVNNAASGSNEVQSFKGFSGAGRYCRFTILAVHSSWQPNIRQLELKGIIDFQGVTSLGSHDYSILHQLNSNPTSTFTLIFKCRARQDCDLHFWNSLDFTDYYRVCIGGWSDTKTWLEMSRGGEKQEGFDETVDRLHHSIWKEFWITITDGVLAYGGGSKENSNQWGALTDQKSPPLQIKYLSVSTNQISNPLDIEFQGYWSSLNDKEWGTNLP